MFMAVILILWMIVLVYNMVYSFLPSQVQNLKFVKIVAILASVIILIVGIKQSFSEFRNFKYAYIDSKNGRVIDKKNFKWEITKTKTREGNIVYIINERYGDASEIEIKPDKRVEYEVYNAIDGIGIKFLCPENTIPNFKIILHQ